MSKMSKTILFFGNERLATGVTSDALVFRGLIDDGYKVAALVIAQKDRAKSRNNREPEITEIARAHNIPVVSYAKLSESTSEIASYHAEAGVLAAYGKIVPTAVIDLFPSGIINIHPSLLPRHRGSTPIESAILDGDTETGVTIMSLAKEMDSGPVFAQAKIELEGNESKQYLANELDSLGSKLLLEHLGDILGGDLKAIPQPTEGITYDKLIAKEDSRIDWHDAAQKIEKQIRAYSLWPKARTSLNDIEITISEAHVIDGNGVPGSIYIDNKTLGVYSSDGILVLDKLMPAGKQEMTGESFIAGYRSRL
jgi:methionyl-tRNA formyltransferase